MKVVFRDLKLKPCSKTPCKEIATDEIFVDDISVGFYCPEHGYQISQFYRKQTSFNDVIGLRESGMTFSEIGKKLGISKQRVHQIYNK